MRLVRVPNLDILKDGLDLEHDDGRRVRVARPSSGYLSASGSSSHDDHAFSWRARLYAAGAAALVLLDTMDTKMDGSERCESTFYAVRPDGSVVIVPRPAPEDVDLDRPLDELDG
jgi:hypothetical protein